MTGERVLFDWLLIVAFAIQIYIQFILHLLRNLSAYRAADSIGHNIGKEDQEIHILLHLSGFHNSYRVIAVVNGSGVLRGDAGKRQGRDTLVSERSRIAGVNTVLAIDAEKDSRN